MKSVVKIQWKQNNEGLWYGELMTATENGFEREKLVPGKKVSFELSNQRRCTGYAPAVRERNSCPEFRKIDTGSQCGECRGRDIYTDYVRGESGENLEADFSVYLAQLGEKIKVGVTRVEKVERRWIEQGADYAAEIERRVSADKALTREKKLSKDGITERVRKEYKIRSGKEKLSDFMEDKGIEGDVVDLREKTIYPEISCSSFERSGLFEGKIEAVKGQIVSNGRTCLAMTSGKTVVEPRQKGLNHF